MITLPRPTDIRTLTDEQKQATRRVIAYRTHPSRRTHVAFLEPYAVICRHHRDKTTKALVEAEATGPTVHDALLRLTDELFTRSVSPDWLCPDCASQVRWWLGGQS